MELAELVALIETAWPTRFERGRVLHLHRNHLTLPNGQLIHLRVLVQTVTPADAGRRDGLDPE